LGALSDAETSIPENRSARPRRSGEATKFSQSLLVVLPELPHMGASIEPEPGSCGVSKRFRGLLCAYCSQRPAVTGDHVFAREFFLKTQRANLPQVPTCDQCNGEKSKLEHYLTAVLPFGGRHADDLANLSQMVEPRLAKNKKLHRRLAQHSTRVWTRTESGLHAPSTALPFEAEHLVELFKYIVRGVLFYHWNVRLTEEHFCEVNLLASDDRKIF